ncbi:M15 family metallopeptidase [Peribacillus deserti]|uniref:Peptidase M15 n=1 Tax=Peribacillus deserti TaxID=673318 RepID=A0A2N5M2J0_9BACI|nr:M15 family metallopeptidase [Peribacillus deserti]PLT28571.1 peptidase M15 [Peribacillus deserti]
MKTRAVTLLVAAAVCLLIAYYYQQQPEEVSSPKISEKSLPSELNPIVSEKKEEFISRAGKQGITIVITDGFRSIDQQNRLYEKGRSGSGSVVTNVRGGDSFHNFGLAFDYALKNTSGQVIWDTQYDGNGNGQPDWFEAAEIAKDLGFEWGGDWEKFKDYPHLQMTFGLTINHLKRGERPEAI